MVVRKLVAVLLFGVLICAQPGHGQESENAGVPVNCAAPTQYLSSLVGEFELTPVGPVRAAPSAAAPYCNGVRLDGGYLRSSDDALRNDGDMSALIAFSLEGKDARLIEWGAWGETEQTNVVYHLLIEDGILSYGHESGAGKNAGGNPYWESTTIKVAEGFHTLTLRRDIESRSVWLSLDGQAPWQWIWMPERDPSGGDHGFFGLGTDVIYPGDGTLQGSVHELRFWDHDIGQTALDALISPDRAPCHVQGAELAYWTFGDPCQLPEQPLCSGSMAGDARADSGPRGIHLEATIEVRSAEPFGRFCAGVEMDGRQWFSAQDSALAITGDFSALIAFEVDEFPGRLINHGTAGESAATNVPYAIRILKGAGLHYDHEYGAGENIPNTSPTPVAPGRHVLALQRSITDHTVRVWLDGEPFWSLSWDPGQDPTGATRGQLVVGAGAVNPGAAPLNGAFYELRLWDRAVAEETLLELSNPAAGQWTSKLEGSEVAAWFFGDVPGSKASAPHATQRGESETPSLPPRTEAPIPQGVDRAEQIASVAKPLGLAVDDVAAVLEPTTPARLRAELVSGSLSDVASRSEISLEGGADIDPIHVARVEVLDGPFDEENETIVGLSTTLQFAVDSSEDLAVHLWSDQGWVRVREGGSVQFEARTLNVESIRIAGDYLVVTLDGAGVVAVSYTATPSESGGFPWWGWLVVSIAAVNVVLWGYNIRRIILR